MDEARRIYIAGPMTGLPEHNFPAFHAAAERLRKAGWQVVNPAENFGGRINLPRERYLREDVAQLVRCDAIALLPGWEESRGAKLEYLLARELGLKVIDIATLQPLTRAPAAAVELSACGHAQAGLHSPESTEEASSESLLDEAKRITEGSRQCDYGHPSDDFARTAAMWTAILAGKLQDGAQVTAADVPLCMIAVKLARQAHRHKRDNLVDIAGYARTAAMVAGDE